jgi:serine/alanine adding enzyme
VIRLAHATDRARFNGYLQRHPHASVYHRWEWGELFEEVYGLPWLPLLAMYNQRVSGVLPLVCLRGPTGRNTLVSMPFFGHGGVIADDDATARCLLDAAAALRDEHNARHVELRHVHSIVAPGMTTRSGKVLMHLDLSPGEEVLWKTIGAPGRSGVRRPEKEGMSVHIGGAELIPEFYAAYSGVMRDLGSPCHAIEVFTEAQRRMPERTYVGVVRYQNQPIAGGFLVGMNRIVEIPCAGSLHRFAKLRPNMLLYWAVIREAIARGYSTFSFGRSTENSGTYTFKKNWGATPVALPYHYLLPTGASLPTTSGDNPVLTHVSDIWKHLPVSVTRVVGPRLARLLP